MLDLQVSFRKAGIYPEASGLVMWYYRGDYYVGMDGSLLTWRNPAPCFFDSHKPYMYIVISSA